MHAEKLSSSALDDQSSYKGRKKNCKTHLKNCQHDFDDLLQCPIDCACSEDACCHRNGRGCYQSAIKRDKSESCATN